MAEQSCYLSPDDLVRLGRRGKLLIPTSSVIFRREPLCKVDLFIPELRWHCDWFAVTVTALRHGLCYVAEPLSDFYLRPTSYYHRGRRSHEHYHVLTSILDRLSSPRCADVAPRIRDSAALALFELPLLWLVMRRSEYRQFLTPMLIWRAGHRKMELVGQEILPKPAARLVLQRLYRQKPTPGRVEQYHA